MSNLNNELNESNRKDPTIDEPIEGHGSKDAEMTEAEVTSSDISDVTEDSCGGERRFRSSSGKHG